LAAIDISLFYQLPPSHNACGVILSSSVPCPEPCGFSLVPISSRDSLSMGSMHQSSSRHLCCGLSVILPPPFHVVDSIFFGQRLSFHHLHLCRLIVSSFFIIILCLSYPLAFLAISSPLPWMTLCLFKQPFLHFILGLISTVGRSRIVSWAVGHHPFRRDRFVIVDRRTRLTLLLS